MLFAASLILTMGTRRWCDFITRPPSQIHQYVYHKVNTMPWQPKCHQIRVWLHKRTSLRIPNFCLLCFHESRRMLKLFCSMVHLSVTKTLTWLISSELLMILRTFILDICIILVVSPFKWHMSWPWTWHLTYFKVKFAMWAITILCICLSPTLSWNQGDIKTHSSICQSIGLSVH